MATDPPTYLPGDTITLRLKLEHNMNIGDSWARFALLGQDGMATDVSFQMDAQEIEVVAYDGVRRTSCITFAVTVTRTSTPPGVYELAKITALPPDVKRYSETEGMVLGAPPGVRLRIAPQPDMFAVNFEEWSLSHWPYFWERR